MSVKLHTSKNGTDYWDMYFRMKVWEQNVSITMNEDFTMIYTGNGKARVIRT